MKIYGYYVEKGVVVSPWTSVESKDKPTNFIEHEKIPSDKVAKVTNGTIEVSDFPSRDEMRKAARERQKK